MKKHLLFSFFALCILACQKKAPTKVAYTAPKNTASTKTTDSSSTLVAELPFQFENSHYLLHLIGTINNEEATTKYDNDYQIANYNDTEITGEISQVLFEKVGSTSTTPLTTSDMVIYNINFCKGTQNTQLIYDVVDADSNKDGKINRNDLKSLYWSDESGHHFTKLSPPMQELIDWKWLPATQKIYFRTSEDTNHNGNLDYKDRIRYFYIPIATNAQAIEYHPVVAH